MKISDGHPSHLYNRGVPLVVENDLILKITPENRRKIFQKETKAWLFDSTPKETTESK